MKSYAGLTHKNTPKYIQEMMTQVANVLESEGWMLRSDSDSAFAAGCEIKENCDGSDDPHIPIQAQAILFSVDFMGGSSRDQDLKMKNVYAR